MSEDVSERAKLFGAYRFALRMHAAKRGGDPSYRAVKKTILGMARMAHFMTEAAKAKP